LSSLLAVAVCATLTGATTFAAIADWLLDLDDDDARILLGFTRGIPVGTTVWRLLTRLDADLLATVLARWLRTRLRTPARQARGRWIVIAVDAGCGHAGASCSTGR
jgi:hypothetical protein